MTRTDPLSTRSRPAGRGRPTIGRAVAACLALAVALGAGEARAQWYDDLPPPAYDWEGPVRPAPFQRAPRPMRPVVSYPMNEAEDLPAPAVIGMLRERGFRNIAPPRRRGLVYVMEAVDPAERRVRLAVECFTGIIVSRQVLGPAMASPIARERGTPTEPPRARAAKPPERQRLAKAEPALRAASPPAPLPPARPGGTEPATGPVEARPAEPAVIPPTPAATGWVTPPPLESGQARAANDPPPRLGPPRRARIVEALTPAQAAPNR